MLNTATVKSSNPKVPPTLTAGRVTLEVLHQWERACKEYFRVKGITQKKKVESILSQFTGCIEGYPELENHIRKVYKRTNIMNIFCT